jgi:hypothetical protein
VSQGTNSTQSIQTAAKFAEHHCCADINMLFDANQIVAKTFIYILLLLPD